MSSRAAIVALLLAAGLAVGSGCGDDDTTTTTAATPVTTAASAPAEPAPTAPAETATGGAETDLSATTPVPTTPTEPDAGDEEGIRVPVVFDVSGSTLTPPQVTVPPTLPIALTVAATDGQAHELVFSTDPPTTVDVPADGTSVRMRLPGQPKGTYRVNVDGGVAVPAIVAIDDAGP